MGVLLGGMVLALVVKLKGVFGIIFDPLITLKKLPLNQAFSFCLKNAFYRFYR